MAGEQAPSIGHGHGHGHPQLPTSRQARRLIAAVLAPLAVLALVAMIALWPDEQRSPRTGLGFDRALAKGTITALATGECGGGAQACPSASVVLTDGPGKGRTVEVPAPSGTGAPELDVADKVVLAFEPSAPSGDQYQITDFQRGRPLLLLALLFAAVVITSGRLRGLAALAGLAVSFAVLLTFVLPAILAGSAPLLVAVVGAAVIMFVVLYLTHGVNAWTSVAVLGTLGALTITGLLGFVFTSLAHFTGLAGSEAGVVSSLYPQVDVRGLLLAGIVIGSLGVLDDVTVTQAVTVAEISRADPTLPPTALYRAAARVGRAHVASTVNTLVLAYAGASLPLLLLFTAGGNSSAELLTSELVAVEVVRAAVGGIGIVAAVPLTTWLAVLLLRTPPPGEQAPAASSPLPGAGTGKRRRPV
ncbi:MAG: YibE/F family protein [Sporichthyaceae bacterium]